MPRGTNSPRYTPSAVPAGLDVILQEWLRRELHAIKAGFDGVHDFEVLYAPPQKLKEGMVRYADGVQWNPGAGKGLYVYNGTAWTKL